MNHVDALAISLNSLCPSHTYSNKISIKLRRTLRLSIIIFKLDHNTCRVGQILRKLFIPFTHFHLFLILSQITRRIKRAGDNLSKTFPNRFCLSPTRRRDKRKCKQMESESKEKHNYVQWLFMSNRSPKNLSLSVGEFFSLNLPDNLRWANVIWHSQVVHVSFIINYCSAILSRFLISISTRKYFSMFDFSSSRKFHAVNCNFPFRR